MAKSKELNQEFMKLLPHLPDNALVEIIKASPDYKRVLDELGEDKEVKYPSDPVEFIEKILGYILTDEQKEIAWSVRDNRRTVVEAAHSIGKCETYDSLIVLGDGRVVTAEKLIDKDFEILGFDPSDWSMRPMLARAEDNGEKDIYKVTLASGRIIERTANHPLLTWDGWKKIEDLKSGNRIAVPTQLPSSSPAAEIPDDEIILLAYLIAEGGLGNTSGVTFSQNPGPVLDEMHEIASRMNCQLKQQREKVTYHVVGGEIETGTRQLGLWGNDTIDIKRSENHILNLVRQYGLSGKNSFTKSIPEEILSLSQEKIALFLNRLFACDGWVNLRNPIDTRDNKRRSAPEIGYCTASETMSQQIIILLLKLGIFARCRKKYNKQFKTSAWSFHIVSSDDVCEFFNIVGYPLGKEEQSYLCHATAKNVQERRPRSRDVDLLPKSAWKAFYKHSQWFNNLHTGRGKSGKIHPRLHIRPHTKPSREIVKRYEDIVGCTLFNGWSKSNVGWDEIKSIKYAGFRPTVAICVPETNAFVTQVIEHNSILSSLLAIWFMCTHEGDVKVITTAPSFAQVQNIIWRYMRHSVRSKKLPGEIFDTPRWNISDIHFALGISTRKATEEDISAMQGFHAPHLLVIMDEAAGLPRLVWEGVSRLATAETNRILAIGNPIEQSGPFYEACNNEGWNHIRVSALDHINVTTGNDVIPGAVSRTWVEDMIRDHCRRSNDTDLDAIYVPWLDGWFQPDPIFKSRVLGIPAGEDEKQLIPLKLVELAKFLEIKPIGERILSLDPARLGGSQAVLCFRVGNKVMWIKRKRPYSKNPSMELAQWVFEEASIVKPDKILVEESGIGAGAVDMCRTLGLAIVGVHPSYAANQRKRFANARAEYWWRIRSALQNELLDLSDVANDDLLVGDLVTPRIDYDPQGRVLIEDKEEIIKRLGRSPDSGDALAIGFYLGGLSDDVASEWASSQPLAQSGGSRWFLGTKQSGNQKWNVNGKKRWGRR